MKQIIFILLSLICTNIYGQDKKSYIQFNKLTEIKGTDYVLASIENRGKINDSTKSNYLLFINTATGKTNQIDFPNGAHIQNIKQIKIDSLGINKIIVDAKTIDLDGKKGIKWNDPTQLLVLSTDGKEKRLLTDKNLFVRNWVVNEDTGTLTVVGHYDTNNNKKYDKTDKNEIAIYHLGSLELLYKI